MYNTTLEKHRRKKMVNWKIEKFILTFISSSLVYRLFVCCGYLLVEALLFFIKLLEPSRMTGQ